ncbi:MAG: DUF1097 family protein [Tractidigestivibacter sp.]|jgi:hypothetical protein|uniref:DUF1097 family protein n=1 Tax=Tractidigestivibacter sp. TaxID=2847320 RepID=UPI003D8AA568
MSDRRKIKLVQSLTGAIVLTLLMQVMGLLGYTNYIWMLFLPLLLFFALGADFKVIPSMIVGYVCGCLWAIVNGLVMQLFSGFGDNMFLSNILPTIIVIFLILTTHENLLEGTIFGNIPSIFLGLATSFFVSMLQVPLTTVHLICFFCYGLVLASVLVLSGMAVCSAIFGKERTMAALSPLPPKDKESDK